MAADKIRVGIIGANAHYGWSMRAHLPALRAVPDCELTAVCTSRPETAFTALPPAALLIVALSSMGAYCVLVSLMTAT